MMILSENDYHLSLAHLQHSNPDCLNTRISTPVIPSVLYKNVAQTPDGTRGKCSDGKYLLYSVR